METLREQRFSLKGKTDRRVRMAERMLSSVEMVDVMSPGGIFLGRARRLTIDVPRFERVVCKIVRGLFFYQLGQVVPDDRFTRTTLDPDEDLLSHPIVEEARKQGTGRRVANDAFEYSVVPASDSPGVGAAFMLFWQRLLLLSWLMRPEPAPPLEGEDRTPRARSWTGPSR